MYFSTWPKKSLSIRKLLIPFSDRILSLVTAEYISYKMSHFYARYVPPSVPQISSPKEPAASHKRPSTSKPPRESKRRKLEEERAGKSEISKNSSDKIAADHQHNLVGPKGLEDPPETASPRRKKSHQEQKNGVVIEHEESTGAAQDHNEAGVARHSKVLSRFSKSKSRASRQLETAPDEALPSPVDHVHPDRANIVHDLKPIPQPQTTVPDSQTPTYSTAPEWLRSPLTVKHDKKQKFEELGVGKKILQNLIAQQKEDALPVQSAVLPLLLDKEVHQRPDLCVAAATGSGKTFAYVLPILNALRKRNRIRLRAVIVVPTRALVKQVAQALESCSAGLDVRIGTAEGSKTLAEEQRQLVEETSVYDLDEYKRQREAPVDWDTFSLDALIEQAHRMKTTSDVGHVQTFLSKVDVLVCTPGRLVEHLQATNGFTLDDVQWFVADEADRLLNESYYEWLETVMPALKSQRATEQRDKLLKQMHMDVPKRRVTKILLSATMTSDISQLLGLELTNPKLVLVEDAKAQQPVQDEDVDMVDTNENAEFSLPPQLTESAIAFKDSENKPLYLLELLEEHVFNNDTPGQDTKGKLLTNGAANHNRAVQGDHGKQSSSSDSEEDSSSIETSSLASSDSDTSSDSSNETSTLSSESDSASLTSSRKVEPPASLLTKQFSGQPQSRVLIFTRSTESAHRLSRLLALLKPSMSSEIATFTRSSTSNQVQSSSKKSKSLLKSRNKILHSFTTGHTRILISTDVAARGLDIPRLEHVVNYDVPASPLIYVHRVGRTARAGQAGHAWTLVEHRQGKWFWETIGGKTVGDGAKKTIGRGEKAVQKVNLVIDKEKWMGRYEDALKKLGEDVRGQ